MNGHKRFFVTCIVSIGWYVINGTHVNLVRYSRYQSFFELFSCFEAKIAAVYVVSKRKRKLAVMEVLGLDAFF